MKSSSIVSLCIAAAFLLNLINALPQSAVTLNEKDVAENFSDTVVLLSSSSLDEAPTSDVAEEYWSTGLSAGANLKRFKAIRAGLLLNLNESVHELNDAIRKQDFKEAQYHLRKMNEKWNRIESLQRSIFQLIPDDNLDTLVEESKLFEENRDVVDRQRETATEFLLKAAKKNLSFKAADDGTETTTEEPIDPHLALSIERKKTTVELKLLSDSLDEAVASGNETEKQAILVKIKTEIWPKIVRLSLEVFDGSSRREHESFIQNWLRKEIASILFKAGDRPCESPDQTLFQDVCITFGKPGSPCKDGSLQLYDGPDNRGVCDCKFQDSSRPYNGLIYSNITGSCHVQNSRGPCSENEWLILKENVLVCEAIPADCDSSDDGRFIYWSPDPSTPESCVELGSVQSCGILNRYGLDLLCTPALVQVAGAPGSSSEAEISPPLKPQPCLDGSYRQQAGLC